jgi:tripartite-type tricarboxylate transporter receptor subunit TctC
MTSAISLLRRPLVALAFAALAVSPTAARAQDAWPSRPIKLIVPFAPGGNTDTIARLTAERLGKALPATFVIENITGAGGLTATNTVAKAAPDGYTLFIVASPQFGIVPALQNVTFDPVRDFTPIKNITFNPFVLVVHKSFPAGNLKELIAWGTANSDQITYASGGVGSVGHLTAALLFAKTGLKVKHVPYRGGAPAQVDVVAGHVPMTFSNLSDALTQAKNPDVRFFAVSSAKRALQLPDVPTVAEQGVAGFETVAWNGLVGPAGLPPAIVARIEKALTEFLKEAATQTHFAELGLEADVSSSADFAARIKADIPAWAEIVRIAGAANSK